MLKIIQNQVLAPFTTFKIGGLANYFARVKAKEELISAIKWAKIKDVPFLIIGGGSNLLVGDHGFRGLIIKNEMDNIQLVAASGSYGKEKTKEQKVYIKAESGVLVNRLVRYMLDNSYSGLQNFLGQPGTVGGAVYINAHNMSKNDFFGGHIINAEVVNVKGESKMVDKKYFQFAYDKSILQKSREFVIWVIIDGYKKNKEGMEKIWNEANEVINLRQKRQPYGLSSAGCIFRNISKSDAIRLKTPKMTTSAGYLIDKCGLKSKQIGQAIISDKHANFIINLGGAKANDVLKLINLAKREVWKKFKVRLVEEIVKIGEF